VRVDLGQRELARAEFGLVRRACRVLVGGSRREAVPQANHHSQDYDRHSQVAPLVRIVSCVRLLFLRGLVARHNLEPNWSASFSFSWWMQGCVGLRGRDLHGDDLH
jgi:hypothetical protein